MTDKQIDCNFELNPEDTDVGITHGGGFGSDRVLLSDQEVLSRLSQPERSPGTDHVASKTVERRHEHGRPDRAGGRRAAEGDAHDGTAVAQSGLSAWPPL